MMLKPRQTRALQSSRPLFLCWSCTLRHQARTSTSVSAGGDGPSNHRQQQNGPALRRKKKRNLPCDQDVTRYSFCSPQDQYPESSQSWSSSNNVAEKVDPQVQPWPRSRFHGHRPLVRKVDIGNSVDLNTLLTSMRRRAEASALPPNAASHESVPTQGISPPCTPKVAKRPGHRQETSTLFTRWSPSSAHSSPGTLRGKGPSMQPFKAYHTSSKLSQLLDGTVAHNPQHDFAQVMPKEDPHPQKPIRERLLLWNELHGQDRVADPNVVADVDQGESANTFTRLGDADDLRRPQEDAEDDRDELAQSTRAAADELDYLDPNHRFLRKGDLVELEFPRSERESILAVFVRRIGSTTQQTQFYTSRGKWTHLPEKQVQYAIPGYVDPGLIDEILPFLPNEEVTDELLDRAEMFDLSVPRNVSAPIISRMLQFQKESEELYREHTATLNSAHRILAHPTDLKFGSLEQIAASLLGVTSKKHELPVTALFTVRKALLHAGFAFGSDRRSHRLTGSIQIRSKEQIKTVETVREWLRQWQDDLALVSRGKETNNHVASEGAQNVYNFVAKAKELIAYSRERRDATQYGSVGPSRTRMKVSKHQRSLTAYHTTAFSSTDREIVRFMEGWACSNLFLDIPRLEALPPLILQATGMYADHDLTISTGFLFLQEIGLLTPYENRVRFDQHLLLPSSQHSRPLENLMTTLLEMEKKPNIFHDSMAHLRHDWKDLPVFCIDQEGAHEIDDGLSIESGEGDEHWVHIHIANPSAFFGGESPLAKMASHMTETIYMPERAFMMLPRWATQKHFSLKKNRPCLTFSAKLNHSGDILDHKVTPGFIRNVEFVTPNSVNRMLGLDGGSRSAMELSVGGELPTESRRRRTVDRLPDSQVEMLKTMQKLAEGRQAHRRNAGGVFLDSHRPELTVWNSWDYPGLGWEPPSRAKARYVDGDPIIHYSGQQFTSWFSSGEDVSNILVREMMLLACEVAAKWSADRNIPIIYRGTVQTLDGANADKFFDQFLRPAMEKNNGELPMHLASDYLRNIGSTILTTKPLLHKILGLQHYSKATSPLRRYGDLILHWQIEAALREEASTGKSLVGTTRQKYLPFSDANLKQVMTGLHPREGMIMRASRYAEDFWSTMLFFRAHHYGECELPATYSATLLQPPRAQAFEISVITKEYGLPCTMTRPEKYGLGEAKAGDWWEVAIEHVDVFYRKVLMRPIRLISRWEQ